MNLFEGVCTRLRHAPVVERLDSLWDVVRPPYEMALEVMYGRRGLRRVINGSVPIYLSPSSRGFGLGDFEPEVWCRMMDAIHPGDFVADVGANIGLYTLAISQRVGGKGHVFAFEPDPRNARELKRNVALSRVGDRVSIVEAVVGSTVGHTRFAADGGLTSHVELNGDRPGSGMQVAMVTLDSVFARRPVDAVKVDVEGFEEQVLLGARRLLTDLSRRPRVLVIEVHPFAWTGTETTARSLLRYLRECRYRVEAPDGQPVSVLNDYGHVIALAD